MRQRVKPELTRRELVAGLAAASTLRLSGGDAPAVRFPTDPRARLAVASYPFRKSVNPRNGTLALVDFPRMAADRFGVSGIEPLDAHFPATDAAYLEKFRAALEQAKAHVVNIPVGRLQTSFYDPDPA
ncbi:MAG: hypothetical protein ACREH9_14650, partial [Pseudomonadota bacterium]